MIPRLPRLASIKCNLLKQPHPVFKLHVPHSSIKLPQRAVHTSPITFGRPTRRKKLDKEIVDYNKDDGMEETLHEGMSVHGIRVPKKLQHWFKDPYGKKSRRDDIQERKVQRLKKIHDRAKMPSIYKKTREVDTGHYSWDGTKMLSVRQVRVATYIQEKLQEVIHAAKGGEDDYMSRMIVDEVEVTKDLKTATVFWSTMDVYSKEKYKMLIEKGELVTALRARLAEKISHMKFIPKLEFLSSDVLIEQEKEYAETEKIIDSLLSGDDGWDETLQELEGMDERHLIPHEKDLDLVQKEIEMLQERMKIIQEKGIAAMTQQDWDYLLEPTRMVSKVLNVDPERLKKKPAPEVDEEDADVIVDTEEEEELKNQEREQALHNRQPPTNEQVRRQNQVWSVLDVSRFKGLENKSGGTTLGSYINEEPGEQPEDAPENPNAEEDYLKRKYRLQRARLAQSRRKRTTRRRA